MKIIDRRRFLGAGLMGAAGLAIAILGRKVSAGAPAAAGTPAPAEGSATAESDSVLIEEFAADGHSLGVQRVAKVKKSDAEWHAQLSALAFEVARRAGTEVAFSGEYASNHTDGLYRCVCCDTALFDSKTKFESGTGWPSFYRTISRHNVAERSDTAFGMVRTAVSCRRCDAHLGHVFDDGPRPTGLRYCMNSVALHLVPRGAAVQVHS